MLDTQTPADNRTLPQPPAGQPRSLEGNALPGEAGQRAEPDRERGPGAGPERTGGSFALRVESGRGRSAVSRQSNGTHPKSYVARLKASRQQPSLFDALPDNPAPHESPISTAPAPRPV